MATLSAIPETNTASSRPQRQGSRGRTIASFEKSRPRSRVILLSRRPSRVRKTGARSQAEAHTPQNLPDIASRNSESANKLQTAPNATQGWTRNRESRRNRFPAAGSISDLDLLNYERLVPALNAKSSTRPAQPNKKGIKAAPPHFNFNTVPSQGSSKCPPQQHMVYSDETVQTQDKLFFPRHPNRATSHAWSGDGTAEAAALPVPGVSRVDERLVEAVTRSVVQQLHLLSLTGQSVSDGNAPQSSELQSSEYQDRQSRTSSQRAALDHFAHELKRYAEHTNAKGKLPVFTPTPVRSGCTLHTVSDLLPFRPEFKAAGLAVTSTDQAKRAQHPTRANVMRATRGPSIKVRPRHPRVSQLDGNDASGTGTTEISFSSPKDMNDWRSVWLDDVSPKKKKHAADKSMSLSRCLPCFQYSDDTTTDGEHTPVLNDPFAKSAVTRMSKAQQVPTRLPKTPVKTPYPKSRDEPLSPLDTGALSIQETIFNIDPSVPKVENTTRSPVRASVNKQYPRPAFFAGPRSPARTTGCRRPSMTLPWQDITRIPSSGRRSTQKQEVSHRLRHYPTMPAGQLNPRRRSRSYRRWHQPKPVVSSPKRYQSLPAKKVAKGLSRLPQDNGSLPNLNSAMRQGDARKPSVDLVVEPPPTRRTSSVIKKSPSGSPKRFAGSSRASTVRTGLPLCARGSIGTLGVRPRIPRRTSSIPGNLYLLALHNQNDVEDRDVLKGLHIAASAACDEQVDDFIRQQTGLEIRRFLADLMAFEILGDEQLGEDIKERVLRRRSEMKKLKQQVRRSREIRKASLMLT